jgi:hypothetical protein
MRTVIELTDLSTYRSARDRARPVPALPGDAQSTAGAGKISICVNTHDRTLQQAVESLESRHVASIDRRAARPAPVHARLDPPAGE